jgi:hypothetical protein
MRWLKNVRDLENSFLNFESQFKQAGGVIAAMPFMLQMTFFEYMQ